MALGDIGKLLLVAGAVIVVVGGVFLLLSRAGVTQLPGSVSVRSGNFSFFFPVAFCVVVSVVLTVVINLILRLRQ